MGRPVDGPGKKPPVPPKSEEIIFDEGDINPPSSEYEFKEGEPGTIIKGRVTPSKEYIFKEGEPGTIITGRRPVEEVFSDGEGSTITVKRPDKRLAQVTKPPKGQVMLGVPFQSYPVVVRNSQGRPVNVHVAVPKNVQETNQVLQEGYIPLARERIDAGSLGQLPKTGTLYLSPDEFAKIK